MTHNLKILEQFADAVLDGSKPFEIRENDRGFQKGDYVQFKVYTKDGYRLDTHPLELDSYLITYVLSGWGLENGMVVFGIKREERADEDE